MESRLISWTLKSQFIECARLKLKDQHSCWSCHTMKTDRQFFHLLDGGDPGRGGWGCTFVIALQLALLQAQVLQVVQVLVLGAGRGLRQPVRKDWFLPSTHMHPPLPICPTLSLTKRHCHICSICFYATSTSCIRYNLSVGLKKRNEPEMSNLNSLALQDCMNW